MNAIRLVMLLLLVALAGCAATENGQAIMGDPASPVIFRLDSQRYTLVDFEQLLEREIGGTIAGMAAEGQTREQIEQQANEFNVRTQYFDRMVQDALLTRYARRNGIGIDPAVVDAEVLSAAAPAEGSPFVIVKDERLRSARNQQTFEVIARNTRAPMTRLRQIVVADEATADQVLADLAAGASFATLAVERSLDEASRAAGGDLGWLAAGSLPPELEQAAASVALNTPTKVATQLGVHVFEVLERDDDRAFASFETLSTNVNANQYFEASFLPWYEELRRQAENSGELEVAANFDPNTVPLPFPPEMP